MEQQDVLKHYADVAARYDELYGFTNDYLADFAVKHLKLKADDQLADIGAGTGAVTSLIWKKAGLTNPVFCVEPSEEMLHIAETRDGIKSCHATADSFFENFNSPSLPKCNKIIFNRSAHLFPDVLGTFHKAFEYLPEDGVLLIITHSANSTLPLWKALQQKFADPNLVDMHMENFEKAGFKTTLTQEVGTTKMTKREWYNKLRKRIFTTLSEFTDEEIEDGIRELDREWLPEKKENDLVEVKITVFIIKAYKKQ